MGEVREALRQHWRALLMGAVVGATLAVGVCLYHHDAELQELQGDLQRAREEFQDAMTDSLAARNRPDTATPRRK